MMKKELLYILSLMTLSAPCYADVEISATTGALDFGTAVPLDASSCTVAIRAYDSEPIWMRAMKASTSGILTAGQVYFSATGLTDETVRVITPNTTTAQSYDLPSGTNCSLRLTNLSFYPASVTLTKSHPSATVNVGGNIQVSGQCTEEYNNTGTIPVSYSVKDENNEVLQEDAVTNMNVAFKTKIQTDVQKNTDMNFGSIVIDADGGTVTLTPLGAISSISDNLIHLGGQTAGEISIFGANGMHINVEYPTENDFITICKETETCVLVDTFTFAPASSFYLNEVAANGQYTKKLSIGATLHIGENQPVGEYSGTLNVRISYE